MNFDYILIAIGIHIAAILFYLFFKKQNLIFPMITGKKKESVVSEEDGIPGSKLIVAGVLILLTAAFVYWLIFIAPPPVEYDDYY